MKKFNTIRTLSPYKLWLKNALLLAFLIFASANVSAQVTCQASFTYSTQNGETQFTSTSSSSSGLPVLHSWQFGSSQFAYNENPKHKFPVSGWHIVTLTIYDSIFNCQATKSDSVFVTGICNASFYADVNDLSAWFDASTKGNGVTYLWTFGDGTSSIDSIPQHTYADSGLYTVCLVVENSITNCSDSICNYVHVKNPVWCNSNFFIDVKGYQANFYYDTTYTGFPNATYSWDFGDNTTSTSKNINSHTYSQKGMYVITLTVTHDSCTSSMVDTIVVKDPPPVPNADIRGYVLIANTVFADTGIAYLIKVDFTDTSLHLVDTTAIVKDDSLNAVFVFENVPPGTYFVKAALGASSNYYNDYMPTYSDTALLWKDAKPINLNGYDMYTVIYLRKGNNPGGPGFIGGKVSQGANKKEGDPLENIQVMLFNEANQPVTYTYSDAEGKFSFNNLAFGSYKVHTEVAGLITIPGFVSLSETTPKVENVDVKVSSTGVATSIFTRLDADFLAQPKLYPNPAQNQIFIETNLRKNQQSRLVIYNLTGQEILSQNLNLQQGSVTNKIDIEFLPAGLYMLQLKNASGSNDMRYKFIKTK